jgi:hypothetical protein
MPLDDFIHSVTLQDASVHVVYLRSCKKKGEFMSQSDQMILVLADEIKRLRERLDNKGLEG